MAAADTTRIDFYFDYISHNAYLAWHALPQLATRHGYVLRPVPVLFAGFLKAYGQLGPAEIPPKLDWMNRNNLRKAALLGIPFNAPARHPFNPLLLLRLTAADMDETTRCALTGALLHAIWAEALEPEDPAAVSACLAAHGIAPLALLAQTEQPAVKSRIRANTDEAIARGAFGVPTMLVGTEVFWGYDDLPFLERFLAGEDPLAQRDSAGFSAAWTACRARGSHRPR